MEGSFSSTHFHGSAYIRGSLRLDSLDDERGTLKIKYEGAYKRGEEISQVVYLKKTPLELCGDGVTLNFDKVENNISRGTYSFFGDEGVFILCEIKDSLESTVSPFLSVRPPQTSSSWCHIV